MSFNRRNGSFCFRLPSFKNNIMSEIRQGVIISFLGKTQDRFSEYQTPATTEQKLEFVSKIDGFSGVEMVFPYENEGPAETKTIMEKYGLEFAAINVNIKKESEWVPGALSRPDKGIRDRAVAMIKKSKRFCFCGWCTTCNLLPA